MAGIRSDVITNREVFEKKHGRPMNWSDIQEIRLRKGHQKADEYIDGPYREKTHIFICIVLFCLIYCGLDFVIDTLEIFAPGYSEDYGIVNTFSSFNNLYMSAVILYLLEGFIAVNILKNAKQEYLKRRYKRKCVAITLCYLFSIVAYMFFDRLGWSGKFAWLVATIPMLVAFFSYPSDS